jgi:type IX secretion system PorP/SprF family membrane protein
MLAFYTKTLRLKLVYFTIPALIVALLLLVGASAKAQQKQSLINYAQFADNIVPFNPAYSLLDKSASINSLLGRQFTQIQSGAPTYFLMNLDVPIESIGSNTGVIIKNNSIGPETLTEINAYFAKSIQLTGKDFLAVSLNAGFRKYVFQDPDPTDPEFTDVRQTNPNVGFGVMLYSDTYYLGISAPELTIKTLGGGTTQTQADLGNHYYITGAILAPMDEDFTFKPAALVAYGQSSSVVAAVSGTLYIKSIIGIGAGYRSDKQISAILSYTVDSFRLGYSYQVGTSSNDFSGINTATHEVTISYRFGKGTLNPKLL